VANFKLLRFGAVFVKWKSFVSRMKSFFVKATEILEMLFIFLKVVT